MLINDAERILPKTIDNALRHGRPYALDGAAAEHFDDGSFSGRLESFPCAAVKLAAKTRMFSPRPSKAHFFAGKRSYALIDNRHCTEIPIFSSKNAKCPLIGLKDNILDGDFKGLFFCHGRCSFFASLQQ